MKKVLFATTALVATAGVAAADVTFGGYGRFGVYYDEGAANETTIESRFRLVVTATAESDNGLSFGAQIRYQANEHADGYSTRTAGFNTPRFWVSTGPFTVSVGQTLGALEFMPGAYAGSIGLTGLGYHNVLYTYGGADAYSSGSSGRQGVDVLYASGNWGVHLSYSPDQTTQNTGLTDTNERIAGYVSYTMANYTFAIGGQSSDAAGDTDAVVTAAGTWGNLEATLMYADNGANDDAYGIGATYQVGSATYISGYVTQNNDPAVDDTYAGIGFQHRLGGGTFLEGGVVDAAGTTKADLGLRFSF
ncbi:porin [Shimia thalassica]|jgi:outer membrane protein OmpU|uniref:porin n=1 Tax=Shimia thalassica TaxID=1715693 RepID=UPI000C087141|nr:porin [Shimia thalassica]PHO05038.1 porin [Rhodobacteraceae bacterium 4F10]MBU2941155.1 porin [Shimia thalassica]MDO6480481.1 porin [Shimia thalassica]MDO6483835.1 porin [Shimia thalassica]MDO6503360.1 porin [Shimia thalassica]